MPADFSNSNYDAILLVSFGGPEGMDDVMPFLENVLEGRNVPRERMLEVAKHYELFGGVSPINQNNRDLISALKRELDTNGPQLPIYFGNRNWHPLLADTIATMVDDGVETALAFVTSAYSSYSSCRQYLENIAEARKAVGPAAPQIEKLRAFFNHPGFIEANVEQIRKELESFTEGERASAHVVFTAHSIPQSMAQNCDYEIQLRETSRLIAEELGLNNWALVFQSRSGSPMQPWLGPDVCDFLKELNGRGVRNVVVAPIGFISDHMEVMYDLDLEARELCEQMGLNMRRAATAGTHPAFIKMIRELIMERVDPATPKRFLGALGVAKDSCEPGCCRLR
ncbi:MAG TPA: ferrochelatase [Pyrinomonadaceae bacterium]|nr:ferrochelatase [Pyrinomonadaceae bacterium]